MLSQVNIHACTHVRGYNPAPCVNSNWERQPAAAQAFLRDLGFYDTPVDKIVASATTLNQSNVSITATNENLLADVADAIERAPTLFGPRTRYQVCVTLPTQIAIMVPLWLVHGSYKIDLLPFWVQLVRVIRSRDLVKFFSDRQEDLAADVRWVAGVPFELIMASCLEVRGRDKSPGALTYRRSTNLSRRGMLVADNARLVSDIAPSHCLCLSLEVFHCIAGSKFLLIIVATAHWLGCFLFYLAAHSNFSTRLYLENWFTSWTAQQGFDLSWETCDWGSMYSASLT
jgi:hypothetical protein